MARLLTDHDPGHIHALLGSIVLLHFLLRIVLIFATGDAFPQRSSFDVALVLVHAALPMVSLHLPLPTKRNFNNPMIWPEFRLHSLAFASRHVLATVFWITASNNHTAPVTTDGLLSMTVLQFGAMMLLVHSTMLAATVITSTLGDTEFRTTNAMPYDPLIPEEQRQRAKRLYAFAQFMAAAYLFVGDPTLAFISLAGIQSAPFLMTLVRKGKCSSASYHCVYTWSLLLPLLVLIRISLSSHVSIVGLNASIVTGTAAFRLRAAPGLCLPKHLVWFIAPTAGVLFARSVPLAVSASPFLLPLLGLSTVGPSIVLIPHIMFRPTKAMTPFVNDYGWIMVALFYFVGVLIYTLNSLLRQQQSRPDAIT